MPKQLVFEEEARRELKKGVDAIANAVKTTLGPKGRNVALDKKFGAPTVTHDGAGDGTTTATVLAQAIVNEGLKNLAAGANPMLLKRGIEKGTQAVSQAIKESSKKVEDKSEIANVATNSAADP